MELQSLLAPIEREMHEVDQVIRERLRSDIVLINELARYIINGGGKRLRPAVVLLAARACGYQGEKHLRLAVVIEFIHTATLLHDDVVDGSKLRRGQQTANAIWGNQASVLTGDFLYSRSFQVMVELGDMHIMEILADTTNAIAEGEVLQLLNTHNAHISEADYMEVIERKTARLFQAGTQLGAHLADCPSGVVNAIARYGLHLGRAYQLVDDALDYGTSEAELGKNIGDDLAEGKVTLPLIHAIKHGSEQESALIRESIASGGLEHIEPVRHAIESTGAIEYTSAVARREAGKALEGLDEIPESSFKEALRELAEFCTDRVY
jgi:octaprenyl-diphosphate synthase